MHGPSMSWGSSSLISVPHTPSSCNMKTYSFSYASCCFMLLSLCSFWFLYIECLIVPYISSPLTKFYLYLRFSLVLPPPEIFPLTIQLVLRKAWGWGAPLLYFLNSQCISLTFHQHYGTDHMECQCSTYVSLFPTKWSINIRVVY